RRSGRLREVLAVAAVLFASAALLESLAAATDESFAVTVAGAGAIAVGAA
ncbi:unnamed protein product, partial [Urochloa humidicola]